MTVPDPHIPPRDRFGVRAGRGVVPAPGSATQEDDGPDTPLQRLLRSTAGGLAPRKEPAPPVAGDRLWRRPERHVARDARTDASATTIPTPAPAQASAVTPSALPDDEVLPPILAALMASRAAAAARSEPQRESLVTAALEATAAAREAEAAAVVTRPAPVVTPAAPVVTRRLSLVTRPPSLATPAETLAPAGAALAADAPRETVDPFDSVFAASEALRRDLDTRLDRSVPPASEPHPRTNPQDIADSIPSARLAAVACPEGEPEPPILHPAAKRLSAPLGRLRAVVRHGRRPRRALLAVGLAAASAIVAVVAGATTAALLPAHADTVPPIVAAADEAVRVTIVQDPPPIASLYSPIKAVVAAVALCDQPAVQSALAAGDATAAIAAAGGAEALRAAVAAGSAPCVDLADSSLPWVVVNKQRTNQPVDYSPATTVTPDGVTIINGSVLRPDAAAALTAMAAASEAAGAGGLGIVSGYRSYDSQVATHESQIESDGYDLTEATSARAGYSEHQTGLAADLVACDGGCGSMDGFGASAQGQWVAANSWQYGWIVRYEDGTTSTTGYLGEPWHLRYIGPELAAVYHAGGYHTLEQFWGLPAAPSY